MFPHKCSDDSPIPKAPLQHAWSTSLRIAYICADPDIAVFGRKPQAAQVQEIVRAFRELGAEVELFATRMDGTLPADLDTLPIHQLPGAPRGNPVVQEKHCLMNNHALRAALKRQGHFDLIYERYSLWSFAGMECAMAAGVPGVLEVDGALIDEQTERQNLIDRNRAEDVAGRVFGASSSIVAVSQRIGDYLKRFPTAAGRIHVVPAGVSKSRFCGDIAPAKLAGGSGLFTVGYVGSMRPWHGMQHLIDAFAALRQLDSTIPSRLLLIGDGIEREHIQQQIDTLNLRDSVIMTGAVTPSEIPALMASMDVAVAPYIQQRPFYFSKVKFYEYMAAGLPIMASAIDEIAQIVQDGVTGLLAKPGDTNALAAQLHRLQRDATLRACLGACGRTTALRDYTWRNVAERILNTAFECHAERGGTTAPPCFARSA